MRGEWEGASRANGRCDGCGEGFERATWVRVEKPHLEIGPPSAGPRAHTHILFLLYLPLPKNICRCRATATCCTMRKIFCLRGHRSPCVAPQRRWPALLQESSAIVNELRKASTQVIFFACHVHFCRGDGTFRIQSASCTRINSRCMESNPVHWIQAEKCKAGAAG